MWSRGYKHRSSEKRLAIRRGRLGAIGIKKKRERGVMVSHRQR